MLDRLNSIFLNSLSDAKGGDPVVDIEGEAVLVRIRRNPRAKRISMRVDTVKREIRMTMPNYAPTKVAMDFVAQKRNWIALRLQSAPAITSLRAGEIVALNGEPHQIVWNATATRTVRLVDGVDGRELHLGGPEEMVEARILRWLKTQARSIFAHDIAHYCQQAGATVPTLSLGDPRSRWGSCSSRGTISLSWRLVMAPAHVRRSVIAHEVAHLRHMDHSPAFYAWLDELFEGDRKSADRWLKMHGTGLQRVGR